MACLLRVMWRAQLPTLSHMRWNSTYPLVYSEEVREAKADGKPIVALESTIITHGMPYPKNLETALEVEDIIRQNSAIPATISIIKGQLRVGLTKEQIQYLAKAEGVIKASRRDLAPVMAAQQDGATTVAGTLVAAQLADIPVFVTGGIGGVHREGEYTMDVSADLTELGRSKTLVVCSGVKSILDIGRTLEYLETQGVTVCAFGESQEFPAFYTTRSGHRAPHHALDASHAARILHAARRLHLSSGIVVAVPVPSAYAMDENVIETAIRNALLDANKQGIRGKEVTPFLLGAVSAATGGASLGANIALIKNNAKVGADIAVQFQKLRNVDNLENAFNIGVSKSSGKCTANSSRQFHTVCATRAKDMTDEDLSEDVLVVGGANVDRTYRVTEQTIQLDGSTHACKTEQCAGGVARNIAEALWRLRNGRARLLTAIGDDADGEYLQSIAPGLILDGCVVKGAKTAMYAAVFDVNGECKLGLGDMDIHNRITIDLINNHITKLKNAPLVVIDGNIPTETMGYVLKLCNEYTKPVFFEPTDRRKAVKPLLCGTQHITFASPNIVELRAMADSLEPNNNIKRNAELDEIVELSKIVMKHINFLFVTRGPKGAVTIRKKIEDTNISEQHTQDLEVRVYNTEVLKAVENVSGAGDCFTSGLIYGILLGISESQCICLGFKTAKEALRNKGTVPNKFNILNYKDKSKYSLFKK